MFTTEKQTASLVTPIRLSTADIGEAPVYFFSATGIVTICRNTVTDVPVPIAVKSK